MNYFFVDFEGCGTIHEWSFPGTTKDTCQTRSELLCRSILMCSSYQRMLTQSVINALCDTFDSWQDNLQDDEDVQAKSEAEILTQYQKDAQSFAEPQTTVLG